MILRPAEVIDLRLTRREAQLVESYLRCTAMRPEIVADHVAPEAVRAASELERLLWIHACQD